MKAKKKSVAGRLFYTFGSVFLLAIVAVCVINFVKDARVFQASVLSAAAGNTDSKSVKDSGKDEDDYTTIQYKKPETGTASKSSSSSSKATGGKAAAPKVSQPVADP